MPPRNLVPFVRVLQKDVTSSLNELELLTEVIRKTTQWQDLTAALKEAGLPFFGTIKDGIKRDSNALIWAFESFERNAPQTAIRITDKVAQPLIEAIKDAVDGRPNEGLSLRALGHGLDGLDRFAWDDDEEEGLRSETLIPLKTLGERIRRLVAVLDRKASQLEVFSTGDAKPEKIETLYHASVKAREIHQRGFQAELPKDQLGLGGAQRNTSGAVATSFTYDLRAALDIARSFKEAAMIATGEIKASDVLDWGLRDDHLKEFLLHLHTKAKKQYQDITHNGRRWVLTINQPGRQPVEEDIDIALEDPVDVFNVYDAYLYTQTSRLNPVHSNRHKLLEYLKSADPRDIGVVSAKVDMSYPGISSHGGEREFRVPPAAIIEVLKFYGS